MRAKAALVLCASVLACDPGPSATPSGERAAPSTAKTEAPAATRYSTRQGAIKGGYDDDTTSNVVGIVSISGYGMGTCSGSLIAPNLVLTARHCVAPVLDEADTGGVDCSKTYFGAPNSVEGLYFTTDATMSRHGNYIAAREIRVPTDTSFCGNDVAVVILAESVDPSVAKPLVPRVDEQVDDGVQGHAADVYSAVGYGLTDDNNNDSGRRRRRDDLTATCFGPHCMWYTGVTGGEWEGETGVCSGDSGGPALDRDNRVIGVASRGAAGCGSPIYSGVAAWADLIMSAGKSAATIGGYAPAAWVTGWPTDSRYSYTVGLPCDNADECESKLCYKGFCSRMCIDTAPCASPFECHPELGICSAIEPGGACTADADCGGDPCVGGVCSRGCNGSVLRCPNGYHCAEVTGRKAPAFTNGFCVPAAVGGECAADNECAGGACRDGVCTRTCSTGLPCPTGFHCDIATTECLATAVGAACTGDNECEGGQCVDGGCTRTCNTSAPCPSTHACADGVCKRVPFAAECKATADCGVGACIDGLCTATCTGSTDCLAGYACDTMKQACVLIPAGTSCQKNDDCGGGTCSSGVCIRPCSAAAPCGAGTVCDAASGQCLVPKEDLAGTSCNAGSRGTFPTATLVLLLAWFMARRRTRASV